MSEDLIIGITCSECGHTDTKTGAWLKSHPHKLSCIDCGADVVIDSEKLFTGIDEAEKAAAKFKTSIEGRRKLH
ncbi:hypothetical protein [Ochrobactrum sp. MYb379]|uniref:hypothetical protein n=1 Tax=Ochrobactrum sp. MYb379 TaxID=2745275 RepID=UPI0030B7CC92